jgi:hypothetical protein
MSLQPIELLATEMAQFVVVPAIDRIRRLFELATGAKFTNDACWKSWTPIQTAEYEWLYDFIRPCHQKLLIETVEGVQENPCSLIRQLLRPHEYRIERTPYGWVLKEGRKAMESGQTISVRKGIMTWSDE